MNVDEVLATTFAEHEHLAPDTSAVLADIRRQMVGRPREARGGWLAAVAAGAAVAAIVFGTTVLLSGAPRRSEQPSLPPHVLTLADKIVRFGTPVGGRFVDRQHGFVLLKKCEYGTLSPAESVDPRFDVPCRDVLEATSDGGATFHKRTLPLSLDFMGFGTLLVFDPTHLVLDVEATTFTVGGKAQDSPAQRWISADGGATWRQVSRQPGSAVSVIPPDAQLLASHPYEGPPAVMTADGVTHPLLGTKPIAAPALGTDWYVLAYAGGSYFTLEQTNTGSSRMIVSRDKGLSWQQAKMPQVKHAPSVEPVPSVVGFDGQWLYAMMDDATSVPGFVASRDGGRTWQALRPLKITARNGMGLGVSPAGGLFFDDGLGLWRADGTGAFKHVPGTSGLQFLGGLGQAMAAIHVSDDGIALAISTDGTHWRDATLS